MKRGAHVYRMFGEAGETLYIGVTRHLKPRMQKHKNVTPWISEVRSISAQYFRKAESAERAERAAICNEGSKYNIHCQKWPLRMMAKTRLENLRKESST